MTTTINCTEYEYDAQPTDGVDLTNGGAWWGTHVKYRRIGSRRWAHFSIVDVHSWDTDAIVAAIDYQENP